MAAAPNVGSVKWIIDILNSTFVIVVEQIMEGLEHTPSVIVSTSGSS